MTENPFTALTAVAAPAILTNACSVLALGTSNRVARVVDRTRVVVSELTQLARGTPPHKNRMAQIERLGQRSHLLLLALRTIYAALGGFATSALLAAVGGTAAFYDQPILSRAAAIIGLIAGLSAVGGLVGGCAFMVAETRLALLSVHQQVEEAFTEPPSSP